MFSKLKETKGIASVETAIVFPFLVVLLILFGYMLKFCQMEAVVKHMTVIMAAEERIGKANAPEYNPDIRYFGKADFVSSVNYSSRETSLGGSVMEADSSVKMNIAIPFVNHEKKYIKAQLFVPFYDYSIDDGQGNKSVWELPLFERGKQIESAMGGNLPEKFETLDIFTQDGSGIKIISVDISKKTYSQAGKFEETIMQAVRELDEFNGGDSEGVYISEEDVKKKSIWVVIPEDIITEQQRDEYDSAVRYAKSLNIEVKMIEYQKIRYEKNKEGE